MVKHLITFIMVVVLFIGVPCGTHAAVELDADDNGAVDIDKGGTNATDGSFDSALSILGSGDSWLEMSNNTVLVDDITGKYGIRFSNGVLQQIISGTPSSIGSGGSEPTIQAADPTVGDPTGFYLSTGTTKFWYRDNTSGNYDFGTYAFTADPALCNTEVFDAGATTTVDSLIFRDSNLKHWIAGKFPAGSNLTSDPICSVSVSFSLRLGGVSGETFHAEIYDDNAGEPGVLVGTGSSATAFNLVATDATETYILFTFPTPVPKSSATDYWVVVKPDWTLDNATYCSAGTGSAGANFYKAIYNTVGASWSTVQNFVGMKINE